MPEMRTFVTTMEEDGLPEGEGKVRNHEKQTSEVKVLESLLPFNEGAIDQ